MRFEPNSVGKEVLFAGLRLPCRASHRRRECRCFRLPDMMENRSDENGGQRVAECFSGPMRMCYSVTVESPGRRKPG